MQISAIRVAKDQVEALSKAQGSKVWPVVLIAGVVTAAIAAWPSTITRMASHSFLPHGFCYMWNKQLLTLHVVSDSLISLSYLALSCTIGWLLHREKEHLPFAWIFVALSTFIVACGLTHAMEVVVLWIPLYWLSGDLKFITAIASVITAIALLLQVPKIGQFLRQAASSRENELRFIGAAESSLDCLYLSNAVRDANGEIEDFVITYVNANAVRLVTVPKEELVGGRMCEIFPFNRKSGLFDKYKHLVSTGGCFVGEFAIQEENIKTSWLRIQAAKLGDGVAISASDITERKNIEKEARDQALIIDMADDTVLILDFDDRITYWNQGAYKLYGWSREQALGQVVHALLKTQYPQPLADIESLLLSQGSWAGELIHTCCDGSLVTVASSWTNRHDEITGEVSLLEINRDITARNAAERELARNRQEIERASTRLQAVNKELEQFAYVASHDLKAPLRVIDNASQWLEEDLAEHLTTETRETMKLLRGRVQRMGKLLDDLLEYARIGREPDNHPREMIAGDVLVSDTLALLPVRNFAISVSPCLSGFQFTRMPLQRILSNLIGNAIKHHDKPEGHIEVIVNERGDLYEFAVHDDGPGIPRQFHEHVFTMFQTLRPRDQVEGSGMGLTMARKTVESFGGKLLVESAEGQGCTFRFTWPKDQRSGREA